jgi:hypothetical protein
MHAEPGRFKTTGFFYVSAEALAKEDAITKKKKGGSHENVDGNNVGQSGDCIYRNCNQQEQKEYP